MSRSYKKPPYSGGNCSDMKRFANQKVRHSKDIPSGKAYRKLFPTWNICEYGSMETFGEFVARINNRPLRYWYKPDNRTEKELYIEWHSMYKRK